MISNTLEIIKIKALKEYTNKDIETILMRAGMKLLNYDIIQEKNTEIVEYNIGDKALIISNNELMNKEGLICEINPYNKKPIKIKVQLEDGNTVYMNCCPSILKKINNK